MANLTLLGPVLLLAFFTQNGESVSCWICSSDVNPSCDDPFHTGKSQFSAYRFENCDSLSASYPYLTNVKTVCKKQIKYINNNRIILRSCSRREQNDYNTSCPLANHGNNQYDSFCETCEYDGCNGASAIGKTIALIITPIALLFK